MIPRLVPEISPLDAFCDVGVGVGVVGVVGIGDSRSWMKSFIWLVGTTNWGVQDPHLSVVCFITFRAIHQGKIDFVKICKCPSFFNKKNMKAPLIWIWILIGNYIVDILGLKFTCPSFYRQGHVCQPTARVGTPFIQNQKCCLFFYCFFLDKKICIKTCGVPPPPNPSILLTNGFCDSF